MTDPGPDLEALEGALAEMANQADPALLDAIGALQSMGAAFLGQSDPPASRARSPIPAQASGSEEPEALVVLDPRGVIAGWSHGAELLFGRSAEQVMGRDLSVVLAPGERPGPGGVPLPGQLGRRADGTTFAIERTVCAYQVQGEAGHAVILRDGAAARRQEEEQARAHARYRMLVEQIPAVTFMAALDESQNEIYIGPQIEALLGYTQQEWLDSPVLWYWRMHPEDRQRWVEEFARGIRAGGPFKNECRFFARDGRTVWVHGEARVVRDDEGKPLFVQGVAFDISEQKRAEEQIRDAQAVVVRTERLAAVGQLAAGVAHDLRNPLGAIRNAWHFVSRKTALRETSDPRVKQMADLIDQDLGRCASIIGDLLDFSRARPPFLVPCPLGELLAEASRVVVKPRPEIELRSALPPDLPIPNVDRHQVRQVLVNLLQNAVEVVPPDRGRVVVGGAACELAGRAAVALEVADNGPGIPPERRERVFEPLFTTKTKGTGLGLAIVETFVRRHGGAVSVLDTPGGGATFRVVLPVGEPSRGEVPLEGGAADLRNA